MVRLEGLMGSCGNAVGNVESSIAALEGVQRGSCAPVLGLCLCCDGRGMMPVPGSGGEGSQGAVPWPGGIQG